MAAASQRLEGWARQPLGDRLESNEQLEILMIAVKISLTIYMYISKERTTAEQLL